MTLFKAYDIRGVVPASSTRSSPIESAAPTAHFVAAGPIAVGRDARVHSPELTQALVDGITRRGDRRRRPRPGGDADAVFRGRTQPRRRPRRDGHGVPQSRRGTTASRSAAPRDPVGEASGLREIERSGAAAAPSRRRRRGSVGRDDVTRRLREQCSRSARARPALKVAIDCGNGMAGVGLEPCWRGSRSRGAALFRARLALSEPSGRPAARREPRRPAAGAVAAGADFGVAFDGDGDRAIFVDERGEPVSADLVTAPAGALQLRRAPGARVLYDLRSSWATAEEIEAAGGVAEMCRVGHSFVKAAMREQRARLRAASSRATSTSASRDTLVADDGIAACVALLDVLGREGRPLSELVAPLRRYAASGEISRRVSDPPAMLAAVEARAPRRRPRSRTSTACWCAIPTGGSTCGRRTPSRCCA